MKFSISNKVIEMFPDLCIGVVVARNVDNKGYPEKLSDLIEERSRRIMNEFQSSNLKDDERIASWREAYRVMGISPKKHPPTSEAYIKRALKGKGLPKISAAVDAYLASELKFFLPIGGYDLEQLQGDLGLCIAKGGGEPFEPLGGGPIESVSEGEIIYKDDERTLTRRWNYRDADPTKITTETTKLILCTESVSEKFGESYLKESVADISILLQRFCDANTWALVFVPKECSTIDIPITDDANKINRYPRVTGKKTST